MPVAYILRIGSFNIQRTTPGFFGEMDVVFDEPIFDVIESVELDPPPRIAIVPVMWNSVYEFVHTQRPDITLDARAKMTDEELLKIYDEEQMKL